MKSEVDFGPWALDLDADALGQVLAALGVVAAASRRRSSLDNLLATASDPAALRGLVGERSAVPWRIVPLLAVKPGAWARQAARHPAEDVAAAWAAAVGNRAPEDLPRLAIERFAVELGPYLSLVERLLRPGVAVAPTVNAPELDSSSRWHWPLRVGLFGDRESRAFIDRLVPGGWAAPLHRVVHLEQEPIADIAVMPMRLGRALATLAELHDPLDVGCVVVLGGFGGAAETRIASLTGALQLRARPWGLAAADVPTAAADQWLSGLLSMLSHDAPLDLALRASLTDHGPWVLLAEHDGLETTRITRAAGRIVAALAPESPVAAELPFEPQAFGLPPQPTAGEIEAAVTDPSNYRREVDGASAVAELGRAVTLQRQKRPLAGEPRWIQAEIRQASHLRGAPRRKVLAPASLHGVDIWIGPDVGAVRGTAVFPEILPRDHKPHRLTVVFAELGGARNTASGEIDLPPSGASTRCRFWFRTPPVGDFRARVIVAFKSRVLQSAVLTAPVSSAERPSEAHRQIDLVVEAALRPGLDGLDGRRSFGATIVHNHIRPNEPAGTIVQGARAVGLELGSIAPTVEKITEILSGAALDPAAYGPQLSADATVKLLYQLAQQGVLLHDDLLTRRAFKELVGTAQRIQIVAADPNAVLPLEFVYELPTPARPPKLCENARQALLDGHCNERYHRRNEMGLLDVVCPSGFWAISRIIERHVADPEGVKSSTGTAYAISAEPVRDRDMLAGLTGALFAASSRVDQVVAGSTASVEATLAKSTGGHAARARTWAAWVQAVSSNAPSLLVLLAHSAHDDLTGTSALEIEEDERAAPGEITRNYVGPEGQGQDQSPPIVLLLGCDTALADLQYQTFVTRFRQQGAALVVGTVATVAGSHAAGVAEALVRALETANVDSEPAFGDLLRDVRRRLLADGEVMGLALTAYGDADWRFPRGT